MRSTSVSVRTMEVSSKFTGNRVNKNNTATTYCLLIVAVVRMARVDESFEV